MDKENPGICRKCKVQLVFGENMSNHQINQQLRLCTPCILQRNKEWRARQDPAKKAESARKKHLNRKFGITVEQYDEMFARQGNVCKVCGCSPSSECRNFAVDHCHSTGKIRGILCTGCNMGIGFAKDDPIILNKMIKYLKEFNAFSIAAMKV